MQTIFIIESVDELLSAQRGDEGRPVLTGHIEVVEASRIDTMPLRQNEVVLCDDPNYQMSLPFHDFFCRMVELTGLKLMHRDAIPR